MSFRRQESAIRCFGRATSFLCQHLQQQRPVSPLRRTISAPGTRDDRDQAISFGPQFQVIPCHGVGVFLEKAVFFVDAGLHEDVEGVVDVVDGQTVGLDGPRQIVLAVGRVVDAADLPQLRAATGSQEVVGGAALR